MDTTHRRTNTFALPKGRPFRDRSLQDENLHLRSLLLRASETTAARTSALMQEGDHRIKNSLQVVASLISMQARQETSISARLSLNSAVSRIQSVARIHDALQENGGADTVDLGAVLEDMCRSLRAMAGDPERIAVSVRAEQVITPALFARSVVLAVNELVLNALRHAFVAGETGAIEVTLAQVKSDIRIVVADDGCGLPDGYADAHGHGAGHGYGMQLVRMMVDQIGGRLEIECSPGARFTLTAPAPALA